MRAPWVALALLLAGCALPLPGVQSDDPLPAERSVFGTILAAEETGAGRWLVDVEARFVDCERNATRLRVEARPPDPAALGGAPLPRPGDEAGVRGHAPEGEDGAWWLQDMLVTIEDYARWCRGHHDDDVLVTPTADAPPAGPAGDGGDGGAASAAARLEPTPLPLGRTHALALVVENRQDEAITVQLGPWALVNEEAYHHARSPDEPHNPSTRTLLEGGRLRGCEAGGPATNLTLAPKHRTRVTVRVTCAADADPTPAYTTCTPGMHEPTIAGGESVFAPGSCERAEPRSRLAALWGRVAWRDELGETHAPERLLARSLEPGLPSRLRLEHPAEVASRDEVRVVARYEDAHGRPVPNATLRLHLDWPGLENHHHPMRHDPALGAHVWTWNDMREWRPTFWREGTRTITVHAEDPADAPHHLPQTASGTIVFG